MQSHERAPASVRLRAGAAVATSTGVARQIRTRSRNTIENGGFWIAHLPEQATFYKPWNMDYQAWAVSLGLADRPCPYLFSLWCEPLRRFQLAAEGRHRLSPPEHLKARYAEVMDPLPVWYAPHSSGESGYDVHAVTQRPMAMYHSWGSQNAWLRQIHGRNPLYVPTRIWESEGFRDDDWARVSSPHGEIVVPVAHMAALNENTVWTWNAIGKTKGRVVAARERAGGDKGISAQSPHPRIDAAAGRRAPLGQFGSGHRPGGMVRLARQDREGRRARRNATEPSGASEPGCQGPRTRRPEVRRMIQDPAVMAVCRNGSPLPSGPVPRDCAAPDGVICEIPA